MAHKTNKELEWENTILKRQVKYYKARVAILEIARETMLTTITNKNWDDELARIEASQGFKP